MTQTKSVIWPKQLDTFWTSLIEPADSITSPHERRNARLLALLLLFSVSILILGRILRPLLNLSELNISLALAWLNVAVLASAYLLSRTKQYKLGAALAVVSMSVIIYIQVIYRAYVDIVFINTTAVWFIPLLFISSFVVSWRATLALIIGNVTALLMLPSIVPFITWLNVRSSLEIITVMSIMILLTAYIRQHDVEQIEQQARDLTESEKRYRTLLEATSEGIVLHDDGLVLDVNDAFLTLFQYQLDEVIGRSVMDFIAPQSHELVWKNVGVRSPYELIGIRKDGSLFDMEVCVKDTNYRGRPVRVVTMEDITTRKQVDAQRIALIAERERGDVLRKFIQDASHDLRTPLATMHTSLYLLRRKSTELEQTGHYLDTLDHQVTHLSEMLDDLFVMLRLDDPEFYMTRKALDINPVVNDIAGDHRRDAASKGLTLKYEPQAELPLIMADEMELTRAITHVLTNAITYTPSEGTVTVRTRLEAGHVVIEVEDTGIGISGEDLPHIFKRFYRADQARQTHGGRSGLGLPIAQRVIDIHGGHITVNSQPGRGSAFQIRLPVAGEAIQAEI